MRVFKKAIESRHTASSQHANRRVAKMRYPVLSHKCGKHKDKMPLSILT